MPNKIFVIGHKSPDLDSVAAAIAYAKFKNIFTNSNDYYPAVAGTVNQETKYILEKYGFDIPELLKSAAGKRLVLVDHNEQSQMVDGNKEAKLVEIVDHHKMNFSYPEPITINVRPWGASCSIVARIFYKNNIEIDKNLAGIMLAAILVDTVITKSPTCTEQDKKIIKKLSQLAAIPDWQEFGLEIFKIRSSVAELTALEILKADYKDFDFRAGKFGIGQVETADLGELEPREGEILSIMEDLRQKENYHSVILFLTDIINEGSKFLVATSDQAGIEKALGVKLENKRFYLEGVMSRKKQVIPPLIEVFDN